MRKTILLFTVPKHSATVEQARPIKTLEVFVEALTIIGFSCGAMGFIFGLTAYVRLEKLTKTLKEKGILEKDYKED